jgi:hypothetical protein
MAKLYKRNVTSVTLACITVLSNHACSTVQPLIALRVYLLMVGDYFALHDVRYVMTQMEAVGLIKHGQAKETLVRSAHRDHVAHDAPWGSLNRLARSTGCAFIEH